MRMRKRTHRTTDSREQREKKKEKKEKKRNMRQNNNNKCTQTSSILGIHITLSPLCTSLPPPSPPVSTQLIVCMRLRLVYSNVSVCCNEQVHTRHTHPKKGNNNKRKEKEKGDVSCYNI